MARFVLGILKQGPCIAWPQIGGQPHEGAQREREAVQAALGLGTPALLVQDPKLQWHRGQASFALETQTTLAHIPVDFKIILLSDINARVGRDLELRTGTTGKEKVQQANSSGILLLSKCTEHDLAITNTIFRHTDKYETTRRHPHSEHWHLLNYVIAGACD
ncbi:hypothetical protein Y1Q_0003326 [Alligator mississippiensis]|uniref:Uncharacterized protein n=1 Tax=Alligator mississippiensis TaxID=8496 RepID=A0A151MEN6_ALLMI|nr:hypothetical protein Y1Q_0003326 [Alligator mississippiensis]